MKNIINYDPDEKSHLSKEILEEAERTRQHAVNVICDPPGAYVGEQSGVSFFALMPFLPQKGDRIDLEDGNSCEVVRIFYKVATMKNECGKVGLIYLVPNIYAYLIPKENLQKEI